MELNQIFCDGLVLQAGKPVRIFGTGEGVVTAAIGGKAAQLESREEKWVLELPAFDYGGPYTLEVTLNGEKQRIQDVWFGDVLLVAGQSNVQLKLCDTNTPAELYQTNEDLRLFTIDRAFEDEEYFHARDKWVKADKETLQYWTALGYLTAMLMHRQLNHKIGIVVCYQGGSIIQSFIPKGILLDTESYEAAEENSLELRNPDYLAWNRDGNIYRAQFSLLIPFAFKAVLWYQGEGNSHMPDAPVYGGMLETLIRRWRQDLQDEDLPFIVVQLADLFHVGCERDLWVMVQDAQEKVAQKLPNVVCVPCKDISETDDIHPKTKLPLAERIAAEMLKL